MHVNIYIYTYDLQISKQYYYTYTLAFVIQVQVIWTTYHKKTICINNYVLFNQIKNRLFCCDNIQNSSSTNQVNLLK